MELPNKSKAHVPVEKIIDYLLSETHSVGKSKARYFRSYGFNDENASVLVNALLEIAQTAQVQNTEKSQFGVKYVLDGEIDTPNGDMIQITTVWIIENGSAIPRFVTAYPAE